MRIRQYTLTILFSMLIALPAFAATKEERRVTDSTDVVDQLLRIPEQSIPPALLSRAYAVAVVPHVVKIGFGLGARRGKGVLVVRQEDGSWSNPSFVTLTGGSFGFQIGAQSTDVILVFKTRKGVDGIANGKFTLGADASVAAGPVGRSTAISTDISFKAEVYSYSRSRGLFAGIALEGAGVTMDRKANAAFYGSAQVTPEQIFSSSGNTAPEVANQFVQILTAQTRRLPVQPSMNGDVPSVSSTAQPPSTVKTYGIPDPDDENYNP
jgi:lipid-binding SYLF domain-containing protein